MYSDIGTHWIALYSLNINVAYFDSFGVKHIPKEIWKFIDNKTIQKSIFIIQAYNSEIRGYFCIGFIDFKKNDDIIDIILNYFKNGWI